MSARTWLGEFRKSLDTLFADLERDLDRVPTQGERVVTIEETKEGGVVTKTVTRTVIRMTTRKPA